MKRIARGGRYAAVAFAGLAAAALAQAAEPGGFYVGAGGGAASYAIDYGTQVDDAYAPTQFVVNYANFGSSTKGGYKAFAGYQVAAPLAFEIAYVNLGKPTGSYAVRATTGLSLNPHTRNATYRIAGWNFSAVATLPVTESLSLHALVGAFYSQYKYSEDGTTALGDPYSFTAPNLWQTKLSFGAGATLRIHDRWSLRVDWDRFRELGNTFALNTSGNGRFDSIDLYTVNLVYRF